MEYFQRHDDICDDSVLCYSPWWCVSRLERLTVDKITLRRRVYCQTSQLEKWRNVMNEYVEYSHEMVHITVIMTLVAK